MRATFTVVLLLASCGLGGGEGGGSDHLPTSGAGPYGKLGANRDTPAEEPCVVVDTTALLVCLGLMGTGVGLLFAGMQVAAIEALDAKHAGVAAGVFSTSRYVGSFAGSVVLARLLATDQSDGFQAVFAMALAAAVVSVVVSLGLPSGVGGRGRMSHVPRPP